MSGIRRLLSRIANRYDDWLWSDVDDGIRREDRNQHALQSRNPTMYAEGQRLADLAARQLFPLSRDNGAFRIIGAIDEALVRSVSNADLDWDGTIDRVRARLTDLDGSDYVIVVDRTAKPLYAYPSPSS